MTDDILLYCVQGLCLILIILTIANKRKSGLVHLAIFAMYSLPLYYALVFHGKYGASFTWWFYLILLTSIQIIILATNALIRFFKNLTSSE